MRGRDLLTWCIPVRSVLPQNECRVALFRKLQGGFTGVLQNRLIAIEPLHVMSRHRLPTLKLLAVVALVVLPAVHALAAPQQSRDRAGEKRDNDKREDDRRERRDSLSDAVRRVERDTRGEVLSAERVQFDGRDMHRVKVVDDQGRVRVFMQEPRSEPVRDAPPRARRPLPPPTRDDDD